MLIDAVAAIVTVSILAGIYLVCVDINQLRRMRAPVHTAKNYGRQ
jgi:hypothetical protein